MQTRKTHDSTIALAIITIALIVGFVLIKSKFSVPGFIDSGDHLEQQRRILLLYHTDHEALLKAGREVLRQGPRDPMNYRPRGPIHIHGFPVPRGVRIPKIIRKLRSYANLINFNGYFVLQMEQGVTGFGVKIYPEGFKTPNRYFRYGNREILPGLWYFDDKYGLEPGYDKRIDRMIKTGRWREPNNTDLAQHTD